MLRKVRAGWSATRLSLTPVSGAWRFFWPPVQTGAGARSPIGTEMRPQERVTLEIGSAVVLGALAIGVQVGHWPLWSTVVAVAGYLAWTVLYSEATVHAVRRQIA